MLRQHPAWQATGLTSFRAMTTGSSIVPQELIDAFAGRGVPVLQVYGATETCPIVIYTRLGGDLTRPGSTGLPGPLCEARIVDADGNELPAQVPGEILIRGDNVLTEYWGNDAPRVTRCATVGTGPATSRSTTAMATQARWSASRT